MVWQEDFKIAMLNTIIKRGTPVDPNKTWHWLSWEHNDPDSVRRKVEQSGVDYSSSSFRDTEWREFAGTCVDPERVIGVEGTIFLNSGEIIAYRYTDTFSNLCMSVLKEAAEADS